MWMYVLGVILILWSLQQLRMTLVYLGILQSSVTGPAPGLVAIAGKDALFFGAAGVLCLTLPWPRIVTYVLLVSVATALIGLLMPGSTMAPLAEVMGEEGRRHNLRTAVFGLAIRSIGFGTSAVFLGF